MIFFNIKFHVSNLKPAYSHLCSNFEYFFTCHYSKTVWLVENLKEIKITHYEKIFSHIKQKSSYFEKGLGINNIFVVSPKNNFETNNNIKPSNIKYIPHTPKKSFFKRTCFQ